LTKNYYIYYNFIFFEEAKMKYITQSNGSS